MDPSGTYIFKTVKNSLKNSQMFQKYQLITSSVKFEIMNR
jgi:hypothetical protein